MALGSAALGVPLALHAPIRIVYNPSDSVPRGWYVVEEIEDAGSLHVGSIVLARLPSDVAQFAAQRGYLPVGVPILKRIGAVASQSVCIRARLLYIDGTAVACARSHDGAYRPLRPWLQCRFLAAGEVFLLSTTNPTSFDSRYFGPIPASTVFGVARPLWTGSAP
ncbi:S26 family signal peptidase (plasmid) [Variovorax sp. EBFNA2]|nr:S26 family signal peptidase [Variovorax boronicumulans]WPG41666.1 S26 family signal peptidase [Variovorax boronicumulans]